jgi:hypothetical protein
VVEKGGDVAGVQEYGKVVTAAECDQTIVERPIGRSGSRPSQKQVGVAAHHGKEHRLEDVFPGYHTDGIDDTGASRIKSKALPVGQFTECADGR